jgi:hypothetical protein
MSNTTYWGLFQYSLPDKIGSDLLILTLTSSEGSTTVQEKKL